MKERTKISNGDYIKSKFEISETPKASEICKPEVAGKKNFADNLDLPASYHKTYIVLMTRDPNCLFAYWEIEPAKIEYARKTLGDGFNRSRYVIRVYDVTLINFTGSNANSRFDIEINNVANNWYIHSVKDSVNYCAELGLRQPNGEFFSLAMSNFSDTPRKSPSQNHNEIWKDLS